jgi:ATP-dependent DNA helicase RecG
LTGGLLTRERQEILSKLAAGELDVVLGTQAVLQEDVRFARLGLVVIDEQHKFGVRQRAGLKRAGGDPHYLVMTATPIPRSVALTLFGDLEVSTIRDAPPGRQPVHTYLADTSLRERWWDFVRKKLLEGRQAYVIAPLVDSSSGESPLEEAPLFQEEDDVRRADSRSNQNESLDEQPEDGSPPPQGVEQLFESLAHGPLEAFRVGLLHGRMTPREKEAAMAAFRSGQTQVLVATTVIEVGVDVPNATIMTIEDGHRFGLSQLHQLRGRICRGTHPGYCTVFAEVKTEESRARLEAFVGSTDGFELAEIDFQLRGPGDILGTQQHGLPPLRIADLHRDSDVLQEAREDARQLVADDPGLALPQHALLRKMMLHRYGQVLELGDVG